FAMGECNFSDHGANRLGASALMQGLADGYFVLPYTIGSFLSKEIRTPRISTEHAAFAEAEISTKNRIDNLLKVKGNQSPESLHRKLGKIMWEHCGMARTADGLKKAIKEIQALRVEFNKDIYVSGTNEEFNPELEKALRVGDFIDLGELMCMDALNRNESCGGHFRVEYQDEANEAKRNDAEYMYVAAWQSNGAVKNSALHKEDLVYENIKLTNRSYK
ncbi:MAG: hypothetical protein RIS64_4423, partial [Bacteroidota bacterium]